MMSHFKFCTIKQKQGQSVNFFLANLPLVMLKCSYTNGQEQLKDQFIFRIMVCDIQDNILNSIGRRMGLRSSFMKPITLNI